MRDAASRLGWSALTGSVLCATLWFGCSGAGAPAATPQPNRTADATGGGATSTQSGAGARGAAAGTRATSGAGTASLIAPAAGSGSAGHAGNAGGAANAGSGVAATSGAGAGDGPSAGSAAGRAGAAGHAPSAGQSGNLGRAGSGGGTGNNAGGSPTAGSGGQPSSETVGTGEVAHPALGPAASDAGKLGGMPFVLVKNWDFGTDGTIRNTSDLVAEFVFHDSFDTIANGTHYGAVIVAPTAGTAITASGLGLPNNKQPVEDPARPNREYTADTLQAHVLPLTASQTSASAPAHDAGNGSFMAKWKLPKGGSLLGQDLLWETRVRFPAPNKAYWFALWCAGNKWNGGAEMDVLESFGAPNTYPPANSFHVDPVGGSTTVNYSSWPNALDSVGVTADKRDLTQWHVFSWFYAKDDTYRVLFDGKQVQSGSIHWTNGGSANGEAIDLEFLFDFGWGWVASGSEQQIQGLDAELPATAFPITYEIDYSRVYLR